MRILLAEDERSLSRAVVALLERSNYAVDAVYDGVEALEYLDTGNYDALILDIMMPRMDGLSVLKKLRQRGNPIPVLILTAKSEIDDKVEGLDNGANDYLTKPFSTRELLARLRAITRTHTSQVSSILRFGNVTLDQTSFELSSPSGSYRLANKEYQMMELLLMNPGQTISTERFLEKIWGYDTETELNVVWVYISYLRKKLAALNANVRIQVACSGDDAFVGCGEPGDAPQISDRFGRASAFAFGESGELPCADVPPTEPEKHGAGKTTLWQSGNVPGDPL